MLTLGHFDGHSNHILQCSNDSSHGLCQISTAFFQPHDEKRSEEIACACKTSHSANSTIRPGIVLQIVSGQKLWITVPTKFPLRFGNTNRWRVAVPEWKYRSESTDHFQYRIYLYRNLPYPHHPYSLCSSGRLAVSPPPYWEFPMWPRFWSSQIDLWSLTLSSPSHLDTPRSWMASTAERQSASFSIFLPDNSLNYRNQKERRKSVHDIRIYRTLARSSWVWARPPEARSLLCRWEATREGCTVTIM